MKYISLSVLLVVAMVLSFGQLENSYPQQEPEQKNKGSELLDCREINAQVKNGGLPKPLESFILTAMGCT